MKDKIEKLKEKINKAKSTLVRSNNLDHLHKAHNQIYFYQKELFELENSEN